tara:strand:- start:690 stop:896 length:207 start_codon:yes stop_codon:yes gene_type:complete
MTDKAIRQLQALREKGMSTGEIQKALGLKAQETVRRWLRGESNPRPEMMQKISELSGEKKFTAEEVFK